MVAGIDESLIDQEIRRIFQPSAQRMLEAAKTFVQAWRETQSVEAVLLQRVRLTHTRVTGDTCTRYDHELIGRARDSELLPTLIAGIPYEYLRNMNDQFTHTDNQLVAALDSALRSAGFDGWGLKVYHPKAKGDERRIYAPDPNPPKKHLGHGTGLSTVVRVDTWGRQPWKSSLPVSTSRIVSGRFRHVLHPAQSVWSACPSDSGVCHLLRTPAAHAMTASACCHRCRKHRGTRHQSACRTGHRHLSSADHGACGSSCRGGGAGCVWQHVSIGAFLAGGTATSASPLITASKEPSLTWLLPVTACSWTCLNHRSI